MIFNSLSNSLWLVLNRGVLTRLDLLVSRGLVGVWISLNSCVNWMKLNLFSIFYLTRLFVLIKYYFGYHVVWNYSVYVVWILSIFTSKYLSFILDLAFSYLRIFLFYCAVWCFHLLIMFSYRFFLYVISTVCSFTAISDSYCYL